MPTTNNMPLWPLNTPQVVFFEFDPKTKFAPELAARSLYCESMRHNGMRIPARRITVFSEEILWNDGSKTAPLIFQCIECQEQMRNHPQWTAPPPLQTV